MQRADHTQDASQLAKVFGKAANNGSLIVADAVTEMGDQQRLYSDFVRRIPNQRTLEQECPGGPKRRTRTESPRETLLRRRDS